MVIALAGRRTDLPDAQVPRFPLENVYTVRMRIREMLKELGASAVVSSAACGADLLALEEARALRIRRRVVLPFGRDRFRQTSVIDRPGGWGAVFDSIADELDSQGDLLILIPPPDEAGAYAAASKAILREAQTLASELQQEAVAVLVWDGQSRGAGDMTQEFDDRARELGMSVREVRTLIVWEGNDHAKK